jgi:heme/copper-type cytochrome/quinol oxidase subunit 4
MALVAALASFTSLACMVLLFRAYARSHVRLLLWSALCFVFLTFNNLLLFLDLTTPPELDFRPYRLAAALIGVFFLLYGFIWEAE